MSRFRHALAERDNHILTLRAVITLLCLCLASVGYGWYSAPQKLTLWFPPDLRSGSTRPWWEVPPASVYAFTFYIFQQLNRWPDNGEEDYSRNLRSLRAYLTPAWSTIFRCVATVVNYASARAACMSFPATATAAWCMTAINAPSPALRP